MKKLIALFLYIFSVTNIHGQTALPPAFVITTDTSSNNNYLPDSTWQMIGDPSGKLTLDQVLESGSFKDTIRYFDYNINTYWIRFRIVNKMQKEAKITFRVNDASRTDLYIQTDGGEWQHLKTGSEVPWSKRDGLKRFNYINTVVPAEKEMVVYERNYKNYYLGAQEIGKKSVSFGYTETIVNNDYINDDFHYIPAVENAFLSGLFVLAFIINLYFLIIVREKEFLYFTLLLLTNAVGYMMGSPDLILREYPLLQAYVNLLFSNPVFFFLLIFFLRHFLKTFIRFPGWDKWLVALAFIQLLVPFLVGPVLLLFHTDSLTISEFKKFTYILGLVIISLSLLITFILYVRKHDKAINLMIIALSPIVCLWFLWPLSQIAFEMLLPGFDYNNLHGSLLSFYKTFDLLQNVFSGWVVIVFSGVLFMRFSSLRKKLVQQELERERERSVLIAQQKIDLEKQVAERTSELSQSLENLKSTQKQLIQSEKMASLGELTAGIAHEIQNPLNFVNNFSDINKDLLGEMKDEIEKGNYGEVNVIASDVIANEEKINHHGKRADAIVKGMLQHSRSSSGVKEPTDINALCDEYLRLSYHGLRAKDKSFNATMKTEFDENIGKINVVPQDIGRVLLNIINNAFYACTERSRSTSNERKKNLQGFQNLEGLRNGEDLDDGKGLQQGYAPTVTLVTRKDEKSITISVRDNGNGIPEKIKDKIFQPFFTTKATGSGTGLGLSLAYDIVKAHGGEIKVNTKPGEGTEFTVILPGN